MALSTSEISRKSIQDVKLHLDQGGIVYFFDVRPHPYDTQIKWAVYYDPEAMTKVVLDRSFPA